MMSKISVIGAGTMGNGIAQTFALHDFHVTLYDISKESFSWINNILLICFFKIYLEWIFNVYCVDQNKSSKF